MNLESAGALLDAQPQLVMVTDRQGHNLFHLACSTPRATRTVSEAARARFVDVLLDRGFEIDLPVGRDACTALFFAVARARDPTLVPLLIERGARPTAAPGGACSPPAGGRHREAGRARPRRFEAAKFLARKGANVNYQDQMDRTALHHGVEKEYGPALLTWVVKHGASPELSDHEGVSPRLTASRKRDKRFIAALPGSPPRAHAR